MRACVCVHSRFLRARVRACVRASVREGVKASVRACVRPSAIRDVSSHRHPTGRPAAFPDGFGLGTSTDGPERLRRPSHPPEIQGGRNAHEHGSRHVSHHPLMGTADVNRRGSV
jgi:hypothetical protein